MQRIAENTYIDETLVTCVEYQLFIDEMVHRGKFFQPDHWVSQQFQYGQARTPVVGVRLTDAGTFCDWLTKREVEGQWYRLPTDLEVNAFPVKPNQYSLPLGYWIDGGVDNFHFMGKNTEGLNPREINRNPFVRKTLEMAGNLDRSAHRRHSVNVITPLDKTIEREISLNLNRAIDRARAINLDRGKGLDDHLDFALNYILDRGQKINDSHNHNRAIDNALVHSLSHALILIHSQAPFNELQLAFDVYTDLYTIQERIARRSPSFEGIRLVKELSEQSIR